MGGERGWICVWLACLRVAVVLVVRVVHVALVVVVVDVVLLLGIFATRST